MNQEKGKINIENAKLFSIEDSIRKHQLLKVDNQLIQIGNQKIQQSTLDAFIRDPSKTEFAEQIGISWIFDTFLHPEFIITPNIIIQVIKEKINDPLELIALFLKKNNLHNDITPRQFFEKVINSEQIDTDEKFDIVCQIIRTAINVSIFLDDIEKPLCRLMYDNNYKSIWNKFNYAGIKIDTKLQADALKKEWNNIVIAYNGNCNLSESMKLVTTRNDLKRDFIIDKQKLDFYWGELISRKLFIIKLWGSVNCLLPIKLDANRVSFIPDKVRTNYYTEPAKELLIKVWSEIQMEENQTFFHDNYREEEITLDGDDALEALIASL